jgi:hypothetical protein
MAVSGGCLSAGASDRLLAHFHARVVEQLQLKESAWPVPACCRAAGAFLAALAALAGPALAAGSGRNAGSARATPSSRLLLIKGARAAVADVGDRPAVSPAGRA